MPLTTTPWLWLPEETPTFNTRHTTARLVLFRKTFDSTLSSLDPAAEISIHVSADTRYILYLNGKRLLFGPAKSYLGEWNYESLDIKPFLKEGRNVLAVKVLRYSPIKEGNMGFARGVIGGFVLDDEDKLGVSTCTPWKIRADDSVRIIPSSEWNRALGPAFLQINEDVDANLSIGDWMGADFDDSAWDNAVVSTMKAPMLPILEAWRLVPRSIPLFPEVEGRFCGVVKVDPTSAGEQVKAWESLIAHDNIINVPANTTTTMILENEVLITAFLELHFRGGAGSTIRILCAECFEYPPEDGNPNPFARNKGDRTDSSGILMGAEDTYTISAIPREGEEVYEPFWFRTFRYIKLTITTKSHPLTLQSMKYRKTHYPLAITTHPHNLPNPESKKWSISIRTLLNCMQETYTDCPFYEQNQFAFDSRLQMLYSYQLSSDNRLARKTINEFHASRRGCDGLVETHFPTPFPGLSIPGFSLSWVLMIYDYTLYSLDGDKEVFVRKYLGGIDSVLAYFASRIKTSTSSIGSGMLGRFESPDQDDSDTWAFVDWTAEWSIPGPGGFKAMAVPPAYGRTGVATYNSLFYAYTLNKAAAVCDFVGRGGVGDEYRQRAEDVNIAVLRHCLRQDEKGEGEFLLDGPDSPHTEKSQHVQVLAVLAGAVTGIQARSILHRALAPSTRGQYVQCSYAQTFYVLEAAVQVGIYDSLRGSLLQPWDDMVGMNLSTWAESAAMPRSDCHGWSAVPVYDLVVNVLGLRPVMPGYKRIGFWPAQVAREWKVSGVFNIGVGGGEGREVRVSWESERVCLGVGFDTEVETVNGVEKVKKGETVVLD